MSIHKSNPNLTFQKNTHSLEGSYGSLVRFTSERKCFNITNRYVFFFTKLTRNKSKIIKSPQTL